MIKHDKKSQAAIQVAILITDGRQQDNTLARQASLAKEEKIKIFTIGIGNRKYGFLFSLINCKVI